MRYLTKLEQRYKSGKIKDCDLCDEIAKVETKIRNKLMQRDMWLHSRDPHVLGGAVSLGRELFGSFRADCSIRGVRSDWEGIRR